MTHELSAHPTDLLPAFVLGALDPDEQRQVAQHVAACPVCQSEADAFRLMIDALPTVVPERLPPQHVKQRLLARIADRRDDPQPVMTPAPRFGPRWLGALTIASLVLALVFGVLLLDARNRLELASGQLAASQRTIDNLRRQQLADWQLASFIGARETVSRALTGADRRAGAIMYMQPNSSHAVLVIRGMSPATAGTTYQFWLARPGVQVPANTFDVGQSGGAVIAIDAPAPVSQYTEVMVTVEPSGGGAQPSGTVILSGAIARAPYAPAPAAHMAAHPTLVSAALR